MYLMTIPKKKRRTINVDGVDYHWVIGKRSDHRQPRATVQPSSGLGAKLFIDPIGVLEPSDIATAIRFAFAHGWNPGSSRLDIYLGFDGAATTEQFVLRNTEDIPYWKEKWSGLPSTGQSQSPRSADQPAADG
jgi:hypothetical protein